MNAKELIRKVTMCRGNNWRLSDISVEGETLLEKIADHYEKCEKCRKTFDAQEYPEEFLIDFERENIRNTKLEDWICNNEEIDEEELLRYYIDWFDSVSYSKKGEKTASTPNRLSQASHYITTIKEKRRGGKDKYGDYKVRFIIIPSSFELNKGDRVKVTIEKEEGA